MTWFMILCSLILHLDCFEARLSFSSTHETEQLLGLEIQLAQSLRSLPITDPNYKDLLDSIYPLSLLQDLKSINPRVYASHPINAVGSAKRTGWEIQWLEPWIKDFPDLANITSHLPSLSDYYEACSSMGLLIETYKLNLNDFVRYGRIRGHDSLHPPDWPIIMNTGISTCNRGWLDIGITLMERALEVFEGSTEEYSLYAKELHKSKVLHDKLLVQKGPISNTHRTFRVPFDKDLRKKRKYEDILRREEEDLWYTPSLEEEVTFSNDHDSAFFHQHCRGASKKSSTSPHRCTLVHNGDPYHKLNPFRMEVLSESPFIGVFKEFMAEKELGHFIENASGSLIRSRTGSAFDSGVKRMGNEGRVRTSKQTWLQESTFNISHFLTEDEIQMLVKGEGRPSFPPNYHDDLVVFDEIAYDVTKRIGRATRLNMMDAWSAEPYQIANYGLGGQYDLHVDAHRFFTSPPLDKGSRIMHDNYGDRIGTFMVYLEDVQQGGATVFPKLSLAVQPSAGDAVFWINLLSNGAQDDRTYHGGCPVLIGSKWITNKWINSNTQMHVHPCPLREEDSQVIRPNLISY